MGIARPCRRGSPLVVLTFLACGLSLAIAIAASQSLPSNSFATRYEQALTETLQLTPQLKEIYRATRLRDAVPDVDDDENDDIGEENGSRRQLKDAPKKQFGLNPPPLNSGPSMADVNNSFFRFDSVTPNAVVDWRQTMYISPIQRQYQCASCWAIAAVDSISMMWAINTNSLPAILSPQQFALSLHNVSHRSKAVLSRLTSFLAASFSHIAFFLPSPLFPPQITGWELVPPYSAQALMKAVSMQPVVAFLSGSAQDFQQYNSRGQLKIYDGLCTTDINHAVLVVGYNYTGSSLAGSYWILKNTWFNTWGDGGYMYLAMSPDVRGKCGIHAYVAFRHPVNPLPPTPSIPPFPFRLPRSIPAMYPVYYPSGPQPVKMNNGPISRADDGNDGRWWMRAFTAAADACSGINPCGAGRCYTRAGMARCDCSAVAGMVEVTGVPTSKCVPRNPCSSRGQYNPCGSGTCVNPGDGTYSCQCPTGYAIGAASDGTQTCVGVAGGPASFLAYPTVPGDSCSSVAAAFGLTTAALTALNPFLNCSFAYLPPSLVLTVANASSTAASPSAPLCTATYTVQPNDTCTTLANTFFAGSLSALRAANPLTCTTSRFFLYPAQVTKAFFLLFSSLCFLFSTKPQFADMHHHLSRLPVPPLAGHLHGNQLALLTGSRSRAPVRADIHHSGGRHVSVCGIHVCHQPGRLHGSQQRALVHHCPPRGVVRLRRAQEHPGASREGTAGSQDCQAVRSSGIRAAGSLLWLEFCLGTFLRWNFPLASCTMPSPARLGELHEMARMVLQGCCLTASPSLAAVSPSFPMTDDSELHGMVRGAAGRQLPQHLERRQPHRVHLPCYQPRHPGNTSRCAFIHVLVRHSLASLPFLPSSANAASLLHHLPFLPHGSSAHHSCSPVPYTPPPLQCQAPYLQVGQKVCINSPLLASLLTASSTSFSLYTVQPNDSLALISSRFITRCTTSSVSPAAIAAANNILETSPLVANTQLIIPCDARVGILDCGCAQSLPVCGADYVTYPSYCDALCNYALPVIQDGVCTGCNAACTGRTGLAPAAGYGCTWSTCPYPNWKCCAVEQTVCENVCRATRDTLGGTTTQMQSNYDSCYSQCITEAIMAISRSHTISLIAALLLLAACHADAAPTVAQFRAELNALKAVLVKTKEYSAFGKGVDKMHTGHKSDTTRDTASPALAYPLILSSPFSPPQPIPPSPLWTVKYPDAQLPQLFNTTLLVPTNKAVYGVGMKTLQNTTAMEAIGKFNVLQRQFTAAQLRNLKPNTLLRTKAPTDLLQRYLSVGANAGKAVLGPRNATAAVQGVVLFPDLYTGKFLKAHGLSVFFRPKGY
ncbi:unnamed protein product [Closterium sp. NIES-53]